MPSVFLIFLVFCGFVSMQHYLHVVLIPLKIINGSIIILEVVAVLSPVVRTVFLK